MAGWLSLRGALEQMEAFSRGSETARAAGRHWSPGQSVSLPTRSRPASPFTDSLFMENRPKGKFLDR